LANAYEGSHHVPEKGVEEKLIFYFGHCLEQFSALGSLQGEIKD